MSIPPPEQHPVLPDTPRVTNDFGKTGPPGFPDTLFGPRDKRYLDFIARQTTRLRGVNAYYFVLKSQTQRIDGSQPVSDAPDVGPFDQRARAGGQRVDEATGISAMYGEPVVIGPRVDSLRRETTPSWDYAEPVEVRGIVKNPQRNEQADPRGTIYIRSLRLDLSRVLCEEEWGIKPQPGDVVRVPNPLGSNFPSTVIIDGYYDVRDVDVNFSRFGGQGFFTVYTMTLSWQSKYDPTRKFPERIIRSEPEPQT